MQTALNRSAAWLPVVFITAHDDPALRTQALLAGAAGFFSKPVDESALLSSLAAFRVSAGRHATFPFVFINPPHT